MTDIKELKNNKKEQIKEFEEIVKRSGDVVYDMISGGLSKLFNDEYGFTNTIAHKDLIVKINKGFSILFKHRFPYYCSKSQISGKDRIKLVEIALKIAE